MGRMIGIIGKPPLPLAPTLDAWAAMETLADSACGMSGFSRSRAVYFQRGAKPDPLPLKTLEERALDAKTPVLIAQYSRHENGPLTDGETPPFHWRDWIFAHQGTIFGAAASLVLNESHPQGSTDSERLGLWILEQIISQPDPTGALADALKAARDTLVYSALNFLLSDGSTLWAYADVSDKRLGNGETLAEREKRYTLLTATVGSAVVIASEPLKEASARWDALKPRTLAVYNVDDRVPQLLKL